MSDVSTWSATDEANTAAPPDGWPEFMQPSMVNNSARAMMGAVRRMYDQQISGAIVLPYLKLSGGQTVSGSVTFSAGLLASSIGSTTFIHATTTLTAGGNITSSGTVQGLDLIATGNVSATGNVAAGANLVGQALQLPDAWALHLDASFKYQTFVLDYYWAWTRVGGTLYYAANNQPVWVMRPSDVFCYNPQGAVGGNGDYLNISDRRFKDAATIAPATQGLAEILQLQPVEFQRLPTEAVPAPMWELGFVAQDVAAVLPQAVSVAGVELPDGTGGLESTEPTLGVTSGAIVAALVNALKTIDARLTALEGGE